MGNFPCNPTPSFLNPKLHPALSPREKVPIVIKRNKTTKDLTWKLMLLGLKRRAAIEMIYPNCRAQAHNADGYMI